MKNYKVVPEWNEEQVVEVSSNDGVVQLSNGKQLRLKPIAGHQNLFELEIGDERREALIRTNSRGLVEISMNGYVYSLKVSDSAFDRFAALLRESQSAVQSKTKVQAPMPGLLKQIVVHNGQSVRKGEKLFVLEAMKMENIIKSPANGIVQNLSVEEGAAVEKGSMLCVIEPAAAV